MNEYLLSVIGTVILSAVLTAILPEGRTLGVVKAVARLACVLAIVAPVLNFFRSGNLSAFGEKNSDRIFSESVIEAEETFIEYYSEMRIRETERALELELSEKYSVEAEVALAYKRQEERVDGRYASDKIKITGIHVKLKEKSNEEVLQKMWEYLTKNYCSEVLIE